MELWEGAALIIGGVWLVGYMSRKNAAQTPMQASVGAPVVAVPLGGTTNQSNLTTVTNQAGGAGTTWGEPLEPPKPNPITGVINPAWGANPPRIAPMPVRYPVYGSTGTLSTPIGSPTLPVRPLPSPVARMPYTRPMDMHLV
jgi:hypothetical protein